MIMTSQDWNSVLAIAMLFVCGGGIYAYAERSLSKRRRRHAR